jgi:hypothetical protein
MNNDKILKKSKTNQEEKIEELEQKLKKANE